eukprot:2668455-Prymnesium_polylepis.1
MPEPRHDRRLALQRLAKPAEPLLVEPRRLEALDRHTLAAPIARHDDTERPLPQQVAHAELVVVHAQGPRHDAVRVERSPRHLLANRYEHEQRRHRLEQDVEKEVDTGVCAGVCCGPRTLVATAVVVEAQRVEIDERAADSREGDAAQRER